MGLPLVLCLCLFPFLQLTVSKGHGPASCPVSVASLVMDLTLSYNHSLVYRKQWWWVWLFQRIILQITESSGDWWACVFYWVILQFTECKNDGPDFFTESFSSLQNAKMMGLPLGLMSPASHSFYVNSTPEIPPALSAGVIFQFSMVYLLLFTKV